MAGKRPARILVVDDHRLVREGLVSLLRTHPEIEVVGEASGGDEAVAKAKSLRPDVVLMDISMPGMNGITATRLIKKDAPEVKVIMLTMLDQEGYVYEAVKAGATGYLLKNAGLEELVSSIKEVNKGGATLYPEAQAQLLKEYVSLARRNRDTYGLSDRELEVLQLLADGLSNKEIAARLYISVQTVKTHITHIFEKLGVRDRTEAVAAALRRGLVT
jgi:DNA-binding NarL/FixJ family response regulator